MAKYKFSFHSSATKLTITVILKQITSHCKYALLKRMSIVHFLPSFLSVFCCRAGSGYSSTVVHCHLSLPLQWYVTYGNSGWTRFCTLLEDDDNEVGIALNTLLAVKQGITWQKLCPSFQWLLSNSASGIGFPISVL